MSFYNISPSLRKFARPRKPNERRTWPDLALKQGGCGLEMGGSLAQMLAKYRSVR